MTSNDLRIRKLQRRLATLLKAVADIQKQTTPSGWVLTWNPARPDIMYVDDERNGTWSDSAQRYPSGKIAYDGPERIPGDVKDAVEKFFIKVRKLIRRS